MRNPRRVRDALLRISFLTLALVFWYPAVLVYVELHQQVLLLTYPLIVLTTAVLYLLACDPLPPSAAKVEERVRTDGCGARALSRRAPGCNVRGRRLRAIG